MNHRDWALGQLKKADAILEADARAAVKARILARIDAARAEQRDAIAAGVEAIRDKDLSR